MQLDPTPVLGSYSSTLNWQDRQRLRAIVKAVHLQHYPSDMVNEYEADKLIDALGPEVGQKMIERALQRGFVT